MSRSSLRLFRGEALEVEEEKKNSLQEVAIQFHIISECGVPPVAQHDRSPYHVTEGSGPTFSSDCVVPPGVIAPIIFFFFPFPGG